MTKILHLLTPLSNQTPGQLVKTHQVVQGNLIADLRSFPVYICEASPNQNPLLNITTNFVAATDYWEVAHNWFLNFTRQTGLQDVLAIDNYGLWWSLNFLQFAPASTDLGNSFAWIDLLDALGKREQLNTIIIYGEHKPLIHLVNQIFKGVRIEIKPTEIAQARAWNQPPFNPLLVFVRVLLSLVYLIAASIWRNDIYVFSTTNTLRNLTIGGEQQLFDVYQGDLIKRLRECDWRTSTLETYGWNASWRGLLVRGWFFPTDLIFLLSNPYLAKFGFYRGIVPKWQQIWYDVKPTLTPHLFYKGWDITPFTLPLLTQMFTKTAPSLDIMAKLWYYILQTLRPKLLYFVTHSYGRSSLTAIIAAKSLNIPTIEQQHGVIHKNHLAYVVPKQIDTHVKFPLCDYIVVWGDYTKHLLTDKHAYQPDQVAVCGFPRLDVALKELPSQTEMKAQLSLPSDVDVVLYTSSTTAEGLMSDILDGIEQTPDTTNIYWLIKLHPGEKTRQKWETAIKQRQLSGIKVIAEEFDFYALLMACDIHVSFASTTIIEAAVLGKLNFGLEVSTTPDPVGYAEVKGFLPVAPRELGITVDKVLNDPVQKKQLLQEQRQFANDWCLHDGHTIDRIVKLIETIIHKG